MILGFPGNTEDKNNNAYFPCNLYHINCSCLFIYFYINLNRKTVDVISSRGCKHPQSNSVRHSKDNRNASYLWRTGRLAEQRRLAGKTKGCCGPRQLRTQRPEGSPAPKSRLPAWSLYPKTHKRFIRSCMRKEGGRGWGSTLDRYKWAERDRHKFMISISHFFSFNGSKLFIEISLSYFFNGYLQVSTQLVIGSLIMSLLINGKTLFHIPCGNLSLCNNWPSKIFIMHIMVFIVVV